MAKKESHTVAMPGWPQKDSQNITLTVALRLVRRYKEAVPSASALMRDFGIGRATAYRWRAALVESMEVA